MLLIVLRVVYLSICLGVAATFVSSTSETTPKWVSDHPVATFFLMVGVTQGVTVADVLVRRKRIDVVSAIYFGLLIGVLLSYLLIEYFEPVLKGTPFRSVVQLLTVLILPYVCISLLMQTKDDFRFIIPYVEFSRELKGGRPLVLDTSALIDGRIADVVDTKILDSPMIVPQFVLLEVQEIADSGDKTRRTRGRRGLEVLSKLQAHPTADVQVLDSDEQDGKGVGSVDQRLVALAKRLKGRVLTSDFNLNKVASLQGVDVVNLNDVANALKPRYLPGEHVRIKVIKEGESVGQGVGYLDDGTMVVCEQAAQHLGKDIEIIVTSVLQSSAGRMIFGRQA